MDKVLITGGAGFIGAHLAMRLADSDCYVVMLDNFSRAKHDVFLQGLADRPNIKLQHGDIGKDKNIQDFDTDFSYVVHLAAVVGVQNVLREPYRVLQDNVWLTKCAIDLSLIQTSLKRFMFASTSEVVADTLQCFGMEIPTPENTPVTIADPSSERTTYLLSKIYGEAMCHHSGIPFTIIRPHNIYGPRMGMAHVIPELLAKVHCARAGDILEIASPNHSRTFCFVEDAVELICRLMFADNSIDETYNIGCVAPEVRIIALARTIVDTVGKELVIVSGQPAPGSPERRCPDMKKTTELTSYVARIGLTDGIRRTYEWYYKNLFKA